MIEECRDSPEEKEHLLEEIRTSFGLNDDIFADAVNYAKRKCTVIGKDDTYLPYLLPDVIKEMLFRAYTNLTTLSRMEVEHK